MDLDDVSTVTVFGSADPCEGDSAYEVARETGRVLAELGYRIANGGYGGTMEAAARGARDAGGKTIGVTCRLWRSAPNAYIDREVETADLPERLNRLIELGTAGYVVLPGATGTLVELAMVWELTSKGMLPARPIVCMGEFWRPVVGMMAEQRPASAEHVRVASGPGDLRAHFAAVQ